MRVSMTLPSLSDAHTLEALSRINAAQVEDRDFARAHETSRTLEVARRVDLDDRETGVLLMLRAQPAIMRAPISCLGSPNGWQQPRTVVPLGVQVPGQVGRQQGTLAWSARPTPVRPSVSTARIALRRSLEAATAAFVKCASGSWRPRRRFRFSSIPNGVRTGPLARPLVPEILEPEDDRAVRAAAPLRPGMARHPRRLRAIGRQCQHRPALRRAPDSPQP